VKRVMAKPCELTDRPHAVTHPVSERIAFVAPSAESVAILRRDLIAALTGRGHRVLCLTPPGQGKHIRILRGLGAQHRVVEPPQPSLRIVSDWQRIASLVTQFADWQPTVVVSSGLATMVTASIAARRAGARRVVGIVNGLPSDGIESVGRRRFADAVRTNDALVFHNRENLQLLSEMGVLPAGIETLVVPGSGIDLKAIRAVALPPLDDGIDFLMLSRLERRRGVMDYKAAAQRLKARWPRAVFRLAGALSDEPDAVSPEVLTEGGAVTYLGHLDDVYAALAACHVYVYPCYAEGMPRSILEALAVGRPVITTRTPGCSIAVDEMVSGCLVPPADPEALTVAMECYLRNPGIIPSGSRAARLKAERRFDVDGVNAALLRTLRVPQ